MEKMNRILRKRILRVTHWRAGQATFETPDKQTYELEPGDLSSLGIEEWNVRVGDEFNATIDVGGEIDGRQVEVTRKITALQPIAPVEYVRYDDFELLVVMAGRTRAPHNWHSHVKGGLKGTERSSQSGFMLTIQSERLEEIHRLIKQIDKMPWREEVTEILVRAHTLVEKWFPVDEDAYHKAVALPSGPINYFSMSRGALPASPERATVNLEPKALLPKAEEEE